MKIGSLTSGHEQSTAVLGVSPFTRHSDMVGSRHPPRPWQSGEQYESLPTSDPQDTDTIQSVGEHIDTPYPDTTQSDRSLSSDSTTSSTTPTHTWAPTVLYPAYRLTASTSDTDGEPASPFPGSVEAYTSIRDGHRRWWNVRPHSRRRRSREGKIWRTFKKCARRIVRHPLFPQQPITIVSPFISI